MTLTIRSAADQLAASAFVIVFVLSFDRTSAAAALSTTPPDNAVDATTANSTAGSVVFALSVVAVLAIGAHVIWKARKARHW